MENLGGVLVKDERRREHEPVLVRAVLEALAPAESSEAPEVQPPVDTGWVVDGTVGAGGHARAILEHFPGVRLFGVDRDPEALDLAAETLAPFGERATLRRGRISELEELLPREGVRHVVAILYDLGVSSMQLDRAERGFSFQLDGPLDMRMGSGLERTAADLVNQWDERDLADVIYHEGDEKRARRIAKAIVEARRRVPFQRTLALADVIAAAVGRPGSTGGGGKTHPATKTFQALRRAVNQEGEELRRGLHLAQAELVPGGRLCVITFHSGEDGVVKRFLREGEKEGCWTLRSKRPVAPESSEVRRNPRARSARLRSAVRRNGIGVRP